MQRDGETATYRTSNRAAAQFVLWTGAWAATLAAARFGPELAGDSRQVAGWAAVAVNVVAGVARIVASIRFVRAVDDLWRAILQDALVVTVGVGCVSGFGYLVVDAAGLVVHDLDIALFPVLLGITWVIAVAVGWTRYR